MSLKLLGILLISFLVTSANAQSTVSTTSGVVSFFSSAPLEDIQATNKRVRALMNTSTGEILVRMRIQDFQFRKSLMKKHFNEEYLESHIYPEAQLSGTVLDFDLKKLSQIPIEVVVKGKMTIHGITQEFQTRGTIKKRGGKIFCEATFPIQVADYNVRIPRLLIRNIAEIVAVNVKLELE